MIKKYLNDFLSLFFGERNYSNAEIIIFLLILAPLAWRRLCEAESTSQ
jgi:hypothetical protein